MYKPKERTGTTAGQDGSPSPGLTVNAGQLSPTGYATQRAQLAPRPPGADLRIGHGATDAAPAPLANAPAPLTVAPAPTADTTQALAPGVAGPVPTAFTSEVQGYAYEYLRTKAYSVAWMVALQRVLRAPESGIADLPTVDAILAKYPVTALDNPKLKGDALRAQAQQNQRNTNKAMAAALKALRATLPDPSLDTEAKATGLTGAGGANGAGKDTPEDLALQAHGGYGAWVSKTLKWGKFLGKSVLAHPEMHDRLANATAYLERKYPSAKGSDLAKALGVHTVVSFRETTPTLDQMYHGIGFAIDLNPHQNNWQIGAQEADPKRGKKDPAWSLNKILQRANTLFGTNEIQSARGMAKTAKKGTTAHAYAGIQRSDQMLLRYRELANDRQKLDAYFASAECPASVRSQGVEHWVKLMTADEAKMMDPGFKLVGDPEGPKKLERPGADVGFMNHRLETVQAMCDAGGLRWLGAGGGDASGDLMHFDGATMSTGRALRSDVDAARAQIKAKKAADAKKATEAKPAEPGTGP